MAWMKLDNDVDEMEFGNDCYQNNIMECNMYQQRHPTFNVICTNHRLTHNVNDAIDTYYIGEIDHINEKNRMGLKFWFDLMDEILKC